MMLEHQIDKILLSLSLAETEETWDRIAKAIIELTNLIQQEGCDHHSQLIPFCRTHCRPILNAVNSERSRLSGPAIDCVGAMAVAFGQDFSSLLSLYFPGILALCGRTSKVTLNRARACIFSVIDSTQLSTILPYFIPTIKDKSTTIRLTSAEGILACLNTLNPPDLERGDRPSEIEGVIRATSRDANADVRKLGKKIFQAYSLIFPTRVEKFTAPLSPTIKKYLEVKSSQGAIASSSRAVAAKIAGLSSSTSSLDAKQVKANPHPPARIGHLRSASSSTLNNAAARTHVATSSADASKDKNGVKKHDMLPPAFVPSRSRTASSHSQSNSRPPSRPDSQSSDHPPVPGSGGSLRSNAFKPSSRDAGPQRPEPTRPTVKPTQSSGPRKVTLVLPTIPAPVNPAKSTPAAMPVSRNKHESAPPRRVEVSRPEPNLNASGPKRTTSDSRLATTEKAHAEPSAPAKTGSTLTHAPERPRSAAATRPQPVNTRPAVAANAAGKAAVQSSRPQPTTRRGVVQPTQSQLARVKSTFQLKPDPRTTKPTAPAKPGWGRPPPAKARQASTAQRKPGPAVEPSSIPLPPSPKRGQKPKFQPSHSRSASAQSKRPPPAAIPLPPSPVAQPAEIQADPHQSESEEESAPLSARERTSSPLEEPQTPENATEEFLEEEEEVHEVEPTVRPISPSSSDDQEDEEQAQEEVKRPETPRTPGFSSEEDEEMEDEDTARPEHIAADAQAAAGPSIIPAHAMPPQTPISTLLFSIERGFLYSPASPLSPPIKYSNRMPQNSNLPPCPFLKAPAQSSNAEADATDRDGRPAFGVVEHSQ